MRNTGYYITMIYPVYIPYTYGSGHPGIALAIYGCAFAGLYYYFNVPKLNVTIIQESPNVLEVRYTHSLFNLHNQRHTHINIEKLIQKGYVYAISKKPFNMGMEYIYVQKRDYSDIDVEEAIDDFIECDVHTSVKYRADGLFSEDRLYSKKIRWDGNRPALDYWKEPKEMF